MTPTTDEALVIRCQLGEPGSIEALVQRWHPALARYVTAWLPRDDQAEDVLQNIWILVLKGLPRLRTPSAIAPWLFRIARAAVMTRLRYRYREPSALDTWDGEDESVVDPLQWTDLIRRLHQLGEPERDVLTLFYLEEMTMADIAVVMEVPEGTVKSRLHRARRQLRMLMQDVNS